MLSHDTGNEARLLLEQTADSPASVSGTTMGNASSERSWDLGVSG